MFIDPAEIQKKEPRGSFEKAKKQGRKSWMVGVLSLLGLFLVSIRMSSNEVVEVDEDTTTRTTKTQAYIHQLSKDNLQQKQNASSHIKVIRHISQIEHVMLLIFHQRRTIISTVVTMGFILAAYLNLTAVLFGVWRNHRLCQPVCASDIVREQQLFIRQNPLTAMVINESSTYMMDVDVCIDGCELATGGECAIISVILWCCCACLTAWQTICRGSLQMSTSFPLSCQVWMIQSRRRRQNSTKDQS
jgi:hypothetical protein